MLKTTTKWNISRHVFLLSSAFLILVAFLVVNLVMVFMDAARDRQNMELVSELRTLSYRVSGLSRDATNGEDEAFTELEAVVNQMRTAWRRLNQNSHELPRPVLSAFATELAAVEVEAGAIVEGRDTILFLHNVVDTLNARLPQLQVEHNQVVDILLDGDAPADQVATAQAQSWLVERIGRNVD